MGGSAFSSGDNPLYTPRMPPLVYDTVRHLCHEILTRYFEYVATPIEGPGKKDYGDVDFLVVNPTAIIQGLPTTETLSKAFHAERSISGKGSNISSFALPWPKVMETKHVEVENDEDGKNWEKFVQVDVNICHDKERWAWELFHQAHGDLWNILGSTIRKYGLTVNDMGLFLRIEDIDVIDRKKSMILLTKNPSEVLDFLGLDVARWWKPFASPREMYEYAATSHFFWANDAVQEADEDKKALKHNDRKRMNQRPIFRQWIEDFLPLCRSEGMHGTQPPSRQQTRDKAFQRFGVQDDYETRLAAFRREQQTDEIRRVAIKGGVPVDGISPEFRSCAIRGLRAIILEGDVSSGIVPPEPLIREDGLHDMDRVVAFVAQTWRQVGEVELDKLRRGGQEHAGRKKQAKGEGEGGNPPGHVEGKDADVLMDASS